MDAIIQNAVVYVFGPAVQMLMCMMQLPPLVPFLEFMDVWVSLMPLDAKFTFIPPALHVSCECAQFFKSVPPCPVL